jgi:hypothetical protein
VSQAKANNPIASKVVQSIVTGDERGKKNPGDLFAVLIDRLFHTILCTNNRISTEPTAWTLVEYEKDDGTEGVWAECPGCGDVVAPE